MTVPGPFTMAQQAQNDFYEREEDLVADYAAAVNEEIKDLFAAGADVVQIDEPYMQARPEKARQYGIAAIERALDGVKGTTALHICFGYAAIIHERPNGYSFLPELAAAPVKQISIETAQSNLDCSILEKIPEQTIILGVLDLSTHEVETPRRGGRAHPSGPAAYRCQAARHRAGLRAEISAPRCGVREDAGHGRRGRAGARRVGRQRLPDGRFRSASSSGPGLCTPAAWAPQIAAFEAERQVIVPDFRGYDSFEAMARGSAGTGARRRFAVAGHSMGGRVALEVFRRRRSASRGWPAQHRGSSGGAERDPARAACWCRWPSAAA